MCKWHVIFIQMRCRLQGISRVLHPDLPENMQIRRCFSIRFTYKCGMTQPNMQRNIPPVEPISWSWLLADSPNLSNDCSEGERFSLYYRIYSDGQKSFTFFLEYFCGPRGHAGEWDFRKSTSSKIAPLPKGGHRKIRENMCNTFARHCSFHGLSFKIQNFKCMLQLSKQRYNTYTKNLLADKTAPP